jgi:hypothetical protein
MLRNYFWYSYYVIQQNDVSSIGRQIATLQNNHFIQIIITDVYVTLIMIGLQNIFNQIFIKIVALLFCLGPWVKRMDA